MALKRCPSCGHAVDEYAVICPGCGKSTDPDLNNEAKSESVKPAPAPVQPALAAPRQAPVYDEPPMQPAYSSEPEPPKKKNTGLLIIIVLLLMLIVGIGVFIVKGILDEREMDDSGTDNQQTTEQQEDQNTDEQDDQNNDDTDDNDSDKNDTYYEPGTDGGTDDGGAQGGDDITDEYE